MVKRDSRSSVQSSELIADVVFGKSGASYRARTIRDWADFYLLHLELPLLRQGKYHKTKSLVDDEDVKFACFPFLRFVHCERRTAVTFEKWIKSHLKVEVALDLSFPSLEGLHTAGLPSSDFCFKNTARAALTLTDMRVREQTSLHIEIVSLSKKMAEWQRRMEIYVGDGMETCIQPELSPDDCKIALVTQNECIFQAQFGKRKQEKNPGRRDPVRR